MPSKGNCENEFQNVEIDVKFVSLLFQSLFSILDPPESPSIEDYMEGTELREGDHKSFKCSTLPANPPAELRWYRGEKEVSYSK